ncbi:MAG: hypothetical protein BWY91_01814 [bacterium ADurb.BinA028]|nr:MAG: hypothetical protein BWY91_01814 [bacterium ADurb.BinA028]
MRPIAAQVDPEHSVEARADDDVGLRLPPSGHHGIGSRIGQPDTLQQPGRARQAGILQRRRDVSQGSQGLRDPRRPGRLDEVKSHLGNVRDPCCGDQRFVVRALQHDPALLGQRPPIGVEADHPNSDRRALAQDGHDARQRPQQPGTVEDDEVVRAGHFLGPRAEALLGGGDPIGDQPGQLADPGPDRLLLVADERRKRLVVGARVRQPAHPAEAVLAALIGEHHQAEVAGTVQDRCLADEPPSRRVHLVGGSGHSEHAEVAKRHGDWHVGHCRRGHVLGVAVDVGILDADLAGAGCCAHAQHEVVGVGAAALPQPSAGTDRLQEHLGGIGQGRAPLGALPRQRLGRPFADFHQGALVCRELAFVVGGTRTPPLDEVEDRHDRREEGERGKPPATHEPHHRHGHEHRREHHEPRDPHPRGLLGFVRQGELPDPRCREQARRPVDVATQAAVGCHGQGIGLPGRLKCEQGLAGAQRRPRRPLRGAFEVSAIEGRGDPVGRLHGRGAVAGHREGQRVGRQQRIGQGQPVRPAPNDRLPEASPMDPPRARPRDDADLDDAGREGRWRRIVLVKTHDRAGRQARLPRRVLRLDGPTVDPHRDLAGEAGVDGAADRAQQRRQQRRDGGVRVGVDEHDGFRAGAPVPHHHTEPHGIPP